MKKLLNFAYVGVLACVCCMVFTGCEKSEVPEIPEVPDMACYDNYYLVDGQKIKLTPVENKYYMLFPTESTQAVLAKLEQVWTMAPIISEYNPYALSEPTLEFAECSETIVNTKGPLSVEMLPELIYLTPYYRTADGSDIGIMNTFEVRVEGQNDLAKLETLAEKNSLVILGQNPFDRSIYLVACTKESAGNVLQMANYMQEVGGFSYAAPDMLTEVYPTLFLYGQSI